MTGMTEWGQGQRRMCTLGSSQDKISPEESYESFGYVGGVYNDKLGIRRKSESKV